MREFETERIAKESHRPLEIAYVQMTFEETVDGYHSPAFLRLA